MTSTTPGTIWILNHYAGTSTSPSTRHYDLARVLVGKGHAVTIFASGFHYQKFVEERLAPGENWKEEWHEGVRFVWLRTYPYRGNEWRRALNMLSYAFRAVLVGRALAEKPDVIVGSSVHPLAALAGHALARNKRSRFFFEVRDLWPQTLIDMGAMRANGVAARLLRALESFLYRRAEAVITLLPYAHEYICDFGVAREKVVWIPNGADLSRYAEIKEYDGGRDDSFTLMYLGAHGKANALDVILEAARIVRDRGYGQLRFVFVGEGPEKHRLVEETRDKQLNNVEFRAAVPKTEIARVMQEADAFIFNLEDLPLFRFGISSNKLFDYLSSGRPVLFSGNTANNPVSDAGAGLSVSARSPDRLADAIVELLEMTPEMRKDLGSNGLAYLKANHDIRHLATRLERVLLG